jgi:hypothetical protein
MQHRLGLVIRRVPDGNKTCPDLFRGLLQELISGCTRCRLPSITLRGAPACQIGPGDLQGHVPLSTKPLEPSLILVGSGAAKAVMEVGDQQPPLPARAVLQSDRGT